MAKKFFRTVIEVEVLTDDGPVSPNAELEYIAREITEGDWSGVVEIKKTEEVSPKRMARLLEKQGSDPEFFGLDKNGNPTQEF